MYNFTEEQKKVIVGSLEHYWRYLRDQLQGMSNYSNVYSAMHKEMLDTEQLLDNISIQEENK